MVVVGAIYNIPLLPSALEPRGEGCSILSILTIIPIEYIIPYLGRQSTAVLQSALCRPSNQAMTILTILHILPILTIVAIPLLIWLSGSVAKSHLIYACFWFCCIRK